MLELNTKFKPKEIVFAIQGDKIKTWEVVKMDITITSNGQVSVRYHLSSNDCSSFSTEDDSKIFKSKTDLIDYMSS